MICASQRNTDLHHMRGPCNQWVTVPSSSHTQRGQHSYILNFFFFCVDKKFENISLLAHTEKWEHFRTQVKELSKLYNIQMSVYVYTATLRQTTCQSQDRWFCFCHIWGGSQSHLDTSRMQHRWRGDCRQDNSWRKDFGVGKCNASRTSGWFTCTHPLIHLLNRSLLI